MSFDRAPVRERFFVLRRTPLGESDDLIVGLGWESGRFSAVVKGSRKPRSRMSGLLEPPVELHGALRPGPTLDGLSQLQLCRAFAGLRQSLEALLTAGFLARLFLEALPERSPIEGVYALYSELHERLIDGHAPVAMVALLAQSRLLQELGLEPELEGCLICGSEAVRGYSPRDGGLLCANCYAGSGFALSSAGLLALRELREVGPDDTLSAFEVAVVRELGRVFKGQLQQHAGLSNRVFRPVLPKGRS